MNNSYSIMDNKDIVVVVVSRYWPTALSVVRSLGFAGYTVDLVASSPKRGAFGIAASSKYIRNAVESVQRSVKESDDSELLANLLSYSKEKAPIDDIEGSQYPKLSVRNRLILFPTDDYTASFTDRHRNELNEIFVMPTAKTSITYLMGKNVQKQIAERAGLFTPASWTISLRNKIKIPEGMIYPCFCKPLESISGFKGEMKRCNDIEDLINHLEYLKQRNSDREILVQEFLEIDSEVDIQGVCVGDGVIIPGMIRKTGIAKLERGVTMSGYMAPIEELGLMANCVKKMLSDYGYIGIFDMELNFVGNKAYFGEVNLRSGGSNYAYFLNGVNLPAMAVKAMMGEDIYQYEQKIKDYGRSFANEKVVWKEFFKGYLSAEERDNILTTGDVLLLGSSDDNVPTQLFQKRIDKELMSSRKMDLRKKAIDTLRSIYTVYNEIIKGYPQRKLIKRRTIADYGEKPRAVVIGRNYCSNLCMARSLGVAGYEVEIVRIKSIKGTENPREKTPIEAYSKYVKAYYESTRGKDGINVINMLERIANKSHKKLIFPTEDVAAYIIDQYYGTLKDKYILPNIQDEAGSIVRFMSKMTQKKLAEKVGLRTIRGRYVKIIGGEYEIPKEGINYPVFIKPNVSRMTSKTRMRRCSSYEELKVALDEIAATRDLDLLVEDYINIKREISLLGLSCKDGVVCNGCFEVLEGGNGSRLGVSLKGQIIDEKSIGSTLDDVIRYVETIGYTGLFDVDLLEDEEGNLYFTEINMRYGASGYALTKCGVNLPGMLADYLTIGVDVDNSIRPNGYGSVFVSEKVIAEEYADGYLSREDAFAMISDADIVFIKNKEDPKPYKLFLKKAF